MPSRWLGVHSFKGGTGKSTITANLAVSLAEQGNKVCVMDMDLSGPGIHVMFDVREQDVKWTMTNVLLDQCKTMDAVIPVTEKLRLKDGQLYFIPASFKVEDMLKLLRRGLEVTTFSNSLQLLTEKLGLDYIFVDTHPGIENDTILTMAACNGLLLISRLDQQDMLGTGIVARLAARMGKTTFLVFNMIPPRLARASLRQLSEELSLNFGFKVLASLPYYEDILESLSSGVFIHNFPNHEYAREMRGAANTIAMTEFRQRKVIQENASA